MEMESTQIFIESIEGLIQQVKKRIVSQDFDCNYDEFMKIKKVIQKNRQISQLISQNALLEMVNLDASYNLFQVNACLPQVLRKYELKDSLTVKICKIDKPDKLNINYFDFLLVNMSQQGIFIDSFGLNLYQSNAKFKQAIKQIKPLLCHHDNLLIEQVQLGDQLNQDQINLADAFMINGVKDIEQTNINLFIQTAKDEYSCIYNLKRIFETIQFSDNNQSNRGFFKFGLSLHSTIGENYLQSIYKFLTTQTQNFSYFQHPSELLMLVSDGSEKKVIEIFDQITGSASSKSGFRYSGFYSSQNPGAIKKFSKELIPVISKSIQLGKTAASIILHQSDLNQQEKNSLNNKQQKQEEQLIETMVIDMNDMLIINKLQGYESPIFIDNGQYTYLDTIMMQQKPLPQNIVYLIKEYQSLGINQFSLQQNLLTQQFESLIYELNLTTHEITVKSGNGFVQNIPPNQTVKYFAKLKSNEKDECEDEEIDESLSKADELKSKLVVRGNPECIDIVKEIKLNIEKDKYALFEIPNKKVIPKEIQKLFTLIELQHKVWIHIGIDTITIQGYKKTLGRIVPQIYKYLNSIEPKEEKDVQIQLKQDLALPSYWEPQEQNLKMVKLDLNSNEGQQVVQLFRKTLQKQIIQIERIQNQALIKNYLFEKQKLLEKGDSTEKLLFHGTRAVDPKIIYNSEEEGFDFRLSNDGTYGRGTYFHETSVYSDGYKFLTPQGTSQMFLATVLIGKPYASGPQRYTAPPFINNQNGVRYDSVMNNLAQGNNMYIVYHNSKSYPLYLITYR
ncbi:poly (ADP-ribose) polymerase family protein (macronuclear) [Tetrahymena thermophila SB210]|uniref:Poly [ADP-ribose] polymerase n=1 Tax=Tetrahymena thermophila (strain SB210) TaxID=312017 RepID=Q23Q08_TETTS|nr:poly (ADP-ribose) polymerase family protein [Tetrahymena thermophila SB210]EAR98527.2 poly (ADP-ribose) polymerase family protein [Tetrahymena thermophila SB210]|eukprot:XP_001018772.2 poly (ADP-ribose) polymerase family protein [Tetrahymena thermophila SB210]